MTEANAEAKIVANLTSDVDKGPRKNAEHIFTTADGKATTDPREAASYTYQTVKSWEQVGEADDKGKAEFEAVLGDAHVVDLTNLPDPSRAACLAFGIKTKCTNVASTARQSKSGDASEDEAISEFLADLERGVWTERESGGSLELLIEAMCRIRETDDRDGVSEWLGAMTPEQLDTLKAHKSVATIITDIRAERRVAKAKDRNMSDLAAELDSLTQSAA